MNSKVFNHPVESFLLNCISLIIFIGSRYTDSQILSAVNGVFALLKSTVTKTFVRPIIVNFDVKDDHFRKAYAISTNIYENGSMWASNNADESNFNSIIVLSHLRKAKYTKMPMFERRMNFHRKI